MKHIIWVPLACLLGLLVGSWGPNEKIKNLKNEIEELRIHANSDNIGGFGVLTQMTHIPDRARVRPPSKEAETNVVVQVESDGTATGTNETQVVRKGPDAPPHFRRRHTEDLRARIDEAKELWQTRVDVARSQWIAEFGLEGDAIAAFDETLNPMNEQLYDQMQGLADQLVNEDEMSPELGLRFMSNFTGVLAETYDKLGQVVPAERRGDVSKMEVYDFIDPGVIEPLIAVQGKLENLPGPHRRIRGR